MIGAWYDDGWVEDLESWDEVAQLLRGEWDRVEHPSWGLSLARADALLAFDLHRRWRARHRRGLHRLGFRPSPMGQVIAWKWDVEPQPGATEPSRFESPVAAEQTAAGAAFLLRLRTALARDDLVREQALHVLRDVFRCEPGDLAVVLVREDDGWGDAGWWDEDDEVWPLPGG